VFGPERFMELLLTDPERFRNLDARFDCGVVLVHYSLVESRELLWWLHTSPDWQLVFVDETAALFVRSVLGPSPWPTVDVDAPDLFPPLDDPVGSRDRARRFARMKFLTALHRNQAALRLWKDTVPRYPGDLEVRTAHALLLYQNGRIPQGDAVLSALLAEHPDDARLQSRAGRLRVQLGDLAGATHLYDTALALEPNRPEALWGRAQLGEASGDVQTARELYGRLLDLLHATDPRAIAAAERLQALTAATPSGGE
jgi:tetratricopeptide (TPR) repeat protein